MAAGTGREQARAAASCRKGSTITCQHRVGRFVWVAQLLHSVAWNGTLLQLGELFSSGLSTGHANSPRW